MQFPVTWNILRFLLINFASKERILYIGEIYLFIGEKYFIYEIKYLYEYIT